MAESTNASSYEVLSRVAEADDDRWPVPQTAMFVTVTSAGLWLVILAGVRWLIA
jgi:hypothetical protein